MSDPLPRVLHVCDNREGVATGLAALAAASAETGWQPSVAVLGRCAEREALQAAGVELTELGGRGHADPLMWARLARLLRRDPPAVIHAWGVPALMTAAMTRPRQAPAALAATFDLRDAAASWSPRVLRSLAPQLAFAAAVDEPTQQWLRQSRPDADDDAPVIPTPFSPLEGAAEPSRESFARWGLADDARLILTAGRLERLAYADEAIWAFELVRVLHPQVRLAIAGDGPDRERLERFARQTSDPGCVVFLGDGRDELSAAMAAAEVYWQLGPSVGTPPGLVRAMLAGKPVVVSNAPVHRALADGDAAAIVPQGDRAEAVRATDELLSDAAVATARAAAAHAQATSLFGAAAAAGSYAALYAAATA